MDLLGIQIAGAGPLANSKIAASERMMFKSPPRPPDRQPFRDTFPDVGSEHRNSDGPKSACQFHWFAPLGSQEFPVGLRIALKRCVPVPRKEACAPFPAGWPKPSYPTKLHFVGYVFGRIPHRERIDDGITGDPF